MGKQLTKIELKKQEAAVRAAAIDKALKNAKCEERDAFTGRQKRKENDYLRRYLRVGLGNPFAIRPAETYQARSYNLSKQVLGLVDHVFVRYRTPLFLYRSVLSAAGMQLIFGDEDQASLGESGRTLFREWFYTAAQGGSLAKKMSDWLTRKEVHTFLQAPAENTIERNLIWARMVAGGMAPRVAQLLVERFGDRHHIQVLGDRIGDLVRFYAREQANMGQRELVQVTDFVAAMIQHRDFSFKGRTLGSMLQLSDDWHRWTYGGHIAVFRSWAKLIPAWQVKLNGRTVRAFELTNNRELGEEGRRQRHCVFGYADYCINGHCRIVSIRWYDHAGTTEEGRITCEVAPKTRCVVQVRGRMNREPADDEKKVIKLWAAEVGLSISDYAW